MCLRLLAPPPLPPRTPALIDTSSHNTPATLRIGRRGAQEEAGAKKAAEAAEAAVAEEQRAVGELKQRAAEAEAELKEVQSALKKHHDAGDPNVQRFRVCKSEGREAKVLSTSQCDL